jgi:hypothetical protein
MRKPSGLQAVVGQPIVTLAILGAGSFCLYLWYLDSDVAVLGLAALWAMGWTLNANTKVAEFRAWKRAWDSMAPGGPRARLSDSPAFRWLVLLAMAAAAGFYLYSNPDEPGFRFGFYWLGAGVALLLLFGLIQACRRAGRGLSGPRRRADPPAIVAVCVSRPVLRVPSLKGAYDALPPHCWRVLGGPGA